MEKEITFSEFQEYLRKVEAYIIVEAKETTELAKKVKAMMRIGYKPIGGLTVKKEKYYQAMMI